MLIRRIQDITFPLIILFLILSGPAIAMAEGMDLSDSILDSISAQGISVGGDLTNNCSTSSNSICQGTFDWNDNHQFDASNHKGSIDMSGNVQQNVSSQINVNATQSATASGVNSIGDMSISNGELSQLNYNNATSFIGGF